jgi:hypothetical protein
MVDDRWSRCGSKRGEVINGQHAIFNNQVITLTIFDSPAINNYLEPHNGQFSKQSMIYQPTYWNVPCDTAIPQYRLNIIRKKYHKAIAIFARVFERYVVKNLYMVSL